MTTQTRTKAGEKRSNKGGAKSSSAKKRGQESSRPERARERAGRGSGGHPLLELQRTHGNQAVQRVIRGWIQPNLEVGPLDDKYEREAEATASRISAGRSVGRVSRLTPGDLSQSSVHEPDEEEAGWQMNAERAMNRSDTGSRLNPTLQTRMEEGFGVDFSDVRVHSGTAAHEASEALNARAFTTGRNIYFAQGEYSPATRSGQKLLAHELTHVVQQGHSERAQGKSMNQLENAQEPNIRANRGWRQLQSQSPKENEGIVQPKSRTSVRRQTEESEDQQPSEGPEKKGEEIVIGGGGATQMAPPPVLNLGGSNTAPLRVSRQENTVQRNGGTAVAAAALGYEILTGAVNTMSEGDLIVTWPTTNVGVIAKDPPQGIRTRTLRNSKEIFSYRKINPITGIEQVNIGLLCHVQYNGMEVQASFSFTANGKRSRLMRDSEIDIRNPLSLETVQAPEEWRRGGVPEIPIIRIPIEVRVDHPWPQSNDNWTFTLVLGGMYGFGSTSNPNDHIENYVHTEN